MNNQLAEFFDLEAAPPRGLTENERAYSVVFNMLGVEQKGIGIDVDADKREVTVLARKTRETSEPGCFWVFGVPADGMLGHMRVYRKGGALEITIPKQAAAMSA